MRAVLDSVTIVDHCVVLAVAENLNWECRGWTTGPTAYLGGLGGSIAFSGFCKDYCILTPVLDRTSRGTGTGHPI